MTSLSKFKGPYHVRHGDEIYDADGRYIAMATNDSAAQALATRLNEADEMEKALREITVACEADCGVPAEHDGDDESVAATQAQHGPIVGSALTFGMLRRARSALPESSK